MPLYLVPVFLPIAIAFGRRCGNWAPSMTAKCLVAAWLVLLVAGRGAMAHYSFRDDSRPVARAIIANVKPFPSEVVFVSPRRVFWGVGLAPPGIWCSTNGVCAGARCSHHYNGGSLQLPAGVWPFAAVDGLQPTLQTGSRSVIRDAPRPNRRHGSPRREYAPKGRRFGQTSWEGIPVLKADGAVGLSGMWQVVILPLFLWIVSGSEP
jgi:hypothetical protein